MSSGSFYNWDGQTMLHPAAVALLLAMAATMLLVRRRFALWPMIVIACFITPSQRAVVAGVDFGMLRLMVLCGWLRVVVRGEATGLRWNRMDTAMVAFAVVRTLAVLFYDTDVVPLVQNRISAAVDIVGMYFLFRCLIRGWEDARWAIAGFAWLSVPVAATFLAEWVTGRNVFGVFGYVNAETIVRDARLRCQGAFAHPIIAGSFWGSMLPLMAALWWKGGQWRAAAVVGTAMGLVIVLTTASSTPVMAVAAGAFGAALFPLRRWMSVICWGAVVMLVALHLSMTKPVWYLISRVTVVPGSTSYYRFQLIDKTIQHFDEWGAIGGAIDTGQWAPGLVDVTNHYVLQCLQGGMPLLLVFCWSLALGFGNVGRMWRAAGDNRPRVIAAWALGVALFVHCVGFLGVSYFGQISLVWNLLLAMLASLAPVPARSRPFVTLPAWRPAPAADADPAAVPPAPAVQPWSLS